MKTTYLPVQKTRRRWQAAVLASALLATASSAGAQSVVFTENMGVPTGTTTIANYAAGTAPATFENKGVLTYGSGEITPAADVRVTQTSSGYPGASGGGNVFFTSSAGTYGFSIESINAASRSSLQLTYGYRKENGAALPAFSVDYWNGSAWVTIANTAADLFNETATSPTGWYLAKTLSLPPAAAIAGLKIRFVKSGTVSIRIDDVKLTAATTSPTITPVANLTTFSTLAGTASPSQSFTVSAVNLTTVITATAPAGFQISTDDLSFGSTATLPTTGGTIYARVSSSASSGEISSSITLSSAGATDVAVPVNAAIRPNPVPLPYGPETFTTSAFPWYTYTVAGTKNWIRATAGGNSFMEINGFDNTAGAVPANAWLILGPFNFPPSASNLVASFNLQRAFNDAGSDAEFTFKYSANYAGIGDPSTATWTDIPFTKPAAVTSSSTVFTPSGAISLPSSLAGQNGVYVAFQLAATSPTATSRWRVDDFELFTSSLPVISVVVNPSTINEGSTAIGTVSIPQAVGGDVTVTVTSADPTRVLVDNGYGDPPAASCEVPIFAGETSALFTVTTIRDFTPGSDVPVQITADGGAAYTFGQTIVTVRNIDLPSADLTSSGYTQDFTSFTSQATLPAGWSLTASTQTYTAWATTDAGAKNSSATVNVFGYQHTGSTGVAQQILTLKNQTGSTINDLVVSYFGRAFENAGNGRDPSYTVAVNGVLYPALSYSTSAGDNVQRTAVISGLAVLPGQTIEIRWTSDGNTAPGSNTRRQIGVSGVSVTVGTAVLPPSVVGVSAPLSTIGQTSAEVSSEVTADGGSPVTARGFVYSVTSVNPDPAIGGTGVTSVPNATPEVGLFSALLTGLAGETQYSVRAYATNAQGTTYSSVRVLTTLGAPLTFSGSYTEAFNNFTSTTSPSLSSGIIKAGWTAVSSLGAQTYVGAWSSGSTSGGFFGGASDPGVLGYQHTSSTGTLTVTARFVNNTGAALSQLYVRYLGRVELVTGTRFPQWTVTVAGVAAPSLTYSTSNGVDETKSALVTGLNVPAGAEFAITWVSDRDNLNTGNSRRIGLANVAVSTSLIPDPAINLTGSLTPFSAVVGTASAAQSFNASGVGLNGNITVTAPANYEVSLDNSVFSSSVTLSQVSGTVTSTPVYVRIAAAAPVGNPAGTVSLASVGATTQTIAVTGTVSNGGSAYDTWASGFGLNPATNGAPTADPDGDSFTNAQEYAFGTNPTQGNGSLLATLASGGNLVVTWLQRSDVTYNVQSTANLTTTAFANDGSVTVVDGPVSPTPPAGYTRKQISVPATGNKFYRVTGTTP